MTEIEKLEARIHNLEISLMSFARVSMQLMPADYAKDVDSVMGLFDFAAIELGASNSSEIKRGNK